MLFKRRISPQMLLRQVDLGDSIGFRIPVAFLERFWGLMCRFSGPWGSVVRLDRTYGELMLGLQVVMAGLLWSSEEGG